MDRKRIESPGYFDEKYAFAKTVPKLLSSPWWIGHIPFSFSLVNALKPKVIVELGTYTGTSFFSFCQAVDTLGLSCKCYGVDMWKGDIHMGTFSQSLYEEILAYKNEHYPDAVFLRKYFDDAANDFDTHSIDILHIDGTHTYEAVQKDFLTWQPKLSSRSVVLFHDIHVNFNNVGKAARHFGVGKFFNSIKSDYPHIEFKHCYGLGVLVVGSDMPFEIYEMVEESKQKDFIGYFANLGENLSNKFQAKSSVREIASTAKAFLKQNIMRQMNKMGIGKKHNR